MTLVPRVLRIAVLAGVVVAPLQSRAQMRAVVLQGDPAPGVAAATFTSFPTSSGHPVCDAVGHVAFAALTSAGPGGLWTDASGALALLALGGASVPWYPGTGTLNSVGQPILSDNGLVALSGTALTPAALNGLWIAGGGGVSLAAGTGVPAPSAGVAPAFQLSNTSTYCFNRVGDLALHAYDSNGLDCLWSFDPPPSVNRFFCAATATGTGPGIHALFSHFCWNRERQYALQLQYSGGALNYWIAQGYCGLIGPVLSDGDIVPTVGGTIPNTCNIAFLESLVPPDLNGANAVAFASTIYNGGVTAANDEVYWLRDATGFHVVARMGDPDPALAPGESIWPYITITGGTPPRLLVSDDGSVAFEGVIQPSTTPAVFLKKPDGTLHVLARNGGPVPGYPGWTFSFPVGAPIEMNHFGQVLFESTVWSPGHISYGTWLFATDDTGSLQTLFVNGGTYTVRTGLTGTVLLSQGLPVSEPLATGGSDGQPRNFSDFGEYVFHGTFTPTGGGPAQDGIFAVKGPGLTLAVGPDAARDTRLDPVAPNPAFGATHVTFDLARPGDVRLEIVDTAGRHVKLLRSGALAAGRYADDWSGVDDAGRATPQGVYFVRLSAAGTTRSTRVVRLR